MLKEGFCNPNKGNLMDLVIALVVIGGFAAFVAWRKGWFGGE